MKHFRLAATKRLPLLWWESRPMWLAWTDLRQHGQMQTNFTCTHVKYMTLALGGLKANTHNAGPPCAIPTYAKLETAVHTRTRAQISDAHPARENRPQRREHAARRRTTPL